MRVWLGRVEIHLSPYTDMGAKGQYTHQHCATFTTAISPHLCQHQIVCPGPHTADSITPALSSGTCMAGWRKQHTSIAYMHTNCYTSVPIQSFVRS